MEDPPNQKETQSQDTISQFLAIENNEDAELNKLKQFTIDGLCSETSFIKQVTNIKAQLGEAMKSIASMPILEESLIKVTEEATRERIRANGLERRLSDLLCENDSLKKQNRKISEISISERSIMAEELEIQKISIFATKKSLEAINFQLEEKVKENSKLFTENQSLSHSLSQNKEALEISEEEQALLKAALESLEPIDKETQSMDHLSKRIDDKFSRRNSSYANIVMENISLSAQLAAAQTECNRLQECLSSVASALEERAPMLAECENAQKQLEQLAGDFESLLESNQQTVTQLELIRSENETLKREENSSKLKITDLKHQVRVLLAQIEGIVPVSSPTSTSNITKNNLSNEDDIISTHLVAFKNLSNLHENNVKLLESIRSLSLALEEVTAESQTLKDELKKSVANIPNNNTSGKLLQIEKPSHGELGQYNITQSTKKSISDNYTCNANKSSQSEASSVTATAGLSGEESASIDGKVNTKDQESTIPSTPQMLSNALKLILEDRITHLEASLLRRDGDIERIQESLQSALAHAAGLKAEAAQAYRAMVAAKTAQATAQGEIASLAVELRTTHAAFQTTSIGNTEERSSLKSNLSLLTERLNSTELLFSKEREDLLSRIKDLEEIEKSLRVSFADVERFSRASIHKKEEEIALLTEQKDSAKNELNSLSSLFSATNKELADTTERLVESERRVDLLLKIAGKTNHPETSQGIHQSPKNSIDLPLPSFSLTNSDFIDHSQIQAKASNLPPGQIAKKYLKMAEEAAELRDTLSITKAESANIIEDLKKALCSEKEKLDSYEYELNELRTEKDKKNLILEELQNKLSAYMSVERDSLEKEHSLRLQIERFSKELDDVRAAHQLLIRTNALDLESLRDSQSKTQTFQNEAIELQIQVSTLSSNLKAITAERNAAEAASKALMDHHQRWSNSLTMATGELNSHSVLQAELELSGLEKAALALETQRLKLSLNRVENSLISERASFAEAISSSPSAQLEAQLVAMTESNIRLREQIDSITSKLSICQNEKEAMEPKIKDLKATITELNTQINILIERVKTFELRDEQSNSDASNRIKGLEDALRLKANRIESILEKYKTLKQGFIDERSTLEVRLQEVESHLSSATSEKERLQAQLKEEKETLLLTSTQLKEALHAKDSLKEKNEKKLKSKKPSENTSTVSSNTKISGTINSSSNTNNDEVKLNEPDLITDMPEIDIIYNEVTEDKIFLNGDSKGKISIDKENKDITASNEEKKDDEELIDTNKDIFNIISTITEKSNEPVYIKRDEFQTPSEELKNLAQENYSNEVISDEEVNSKDTNEDQYHEELSSKNINDEHFAENQSDILKEIPGNNDLQKKEDILISEETKILTNDENITEYVKPIYNNPFQFHEKIENRASPIAHDSPIPIKPQIGENELEQREDELRNKLLQRRIERQKANQAILTTPPSPVGSGHGEVEDVKKPIKRITPPEFSTSEVTNEGNSGIIQSYINPYLKRQKNITGNFSQIGQDKKKTKKKN